MVRILVAPDKFKGSLTAQEVCLAITSGLKNSKREIKATSIPLADGGEGTFDILTQLYQATVISKEVHDPLFRPLMARYGISLDGTTALIEMATASGLQLVEKENRNPLYTTTFGTGELIADALDRRVKKIVLGIGGSATNDGGIGMASALGYEFLDKAGKKIKPVGAGLTDIHSIASTDRHPNIFKTEIVVLSDVNNPLFGENGAAFVYGPQKGADPETVRILDHGLRRFAKIVKATVGQNPDFPGAGAAGGLGAGAKVFLGATVTSGIAYIMGLTDLEKKIIENDMIITGEGRFDQQTFSGKVAGEVARLARLYRKPHVIVCGKFELTPLQLQALHPADLISLVDANTTEQYAIHNAFDLISKKISALFATKK